MENKDRSIHPITTDFLDFGLTKREWMATILLSGILCRETNRDGIVDVAIEYTDTLLQRLKDTNVRSK